MTRPLGGRVRRPHSIPTPLCIALFVASVAFIAFVIFGGAR
ncbi:hypothetical protein FHS67_002145 [Aminobacter aminovorans]|uniref:Uncharacterized protein n=1 Tax=Aminobacter aminovorans TaxID=83263 RepID=A0AAC9ARB4_AMIAI|nr:hypothetical protein AA2016_2263 [Aminobacter aminovorans]MBB3705826.1 hypothetical protein [Aminobacter aminovorans]